jgi:hypothetical protein
VERKIAVETKLKASVSGDLVLEPCMFGVIYIGKIGEDYRLLISVLTFCDEVKAVLQIGLNSGSPTRSDYETTVKGMNLVLKANPHFKFITPPATVKSNTRTNYKLERILEERMRNMAL